MLAAIKKEFESLADKTRADFLAGFFKTGKGEYGEGDVFLGIVVPKQRKLARTYKTLSMQGIESLLASQYHEHRLTALFILVLRYEKSSEKEKSEIYKFYLRKIDRINSWDLVDLSSHKIVGEYLRTRSRKKLYILAKSKNLWRRRIAILSTLAFIRNHEFDDTLAISEVLLHDKHDLIHKAVGWMLREVGKREQKVEERFLDKHYKKMPRTMLRYAIEKFDLKKREKYMRKS